MNINSLKEEVDQSLKAYFNKDREYNKVLYDSMAYSINVGGKRIRPILMLLSYYIYKSDYKKILTPAMAIEMIHTYSLIHDDLPCMDNDDLRRGKPTNHKVFGEAIAVLAGDALLNEAMNIFFDFSLKNGENSLRACSIISKASGADGMIGGQVVDIESEGKSIDMEKLDFIHMNKTAAIIVIIIINGVCILKFKTVAIAIAPKATWESPSPINEKRFNTKETPKSDEHKAIKTPTIKAYWTKG